MVAATAKQPTVKWAQRPDSIFVTVDVVLSSEEKDLKIDFTEEKLEVSCKDSSGALYEFKLEFQHPIDKEESKFSAKRNLEFLFMKKDKEAEEGWTNLSKTKQKWIQVDWNKWVDSDDEGEDFDASGMGGMPPGGMGGMPGMGGMGGMPGMGGEGGMDMSALQAMMGGAGGAGGMDMSALQGMMGGAGAGGAGGMDMSALQGMMGGMGGGEGGLGGPDSDDEEDLKDLEDDGK